MNSSLSEYHSKYATRNWHIFPCHTIQNGRCTCGSSACSSPGKHPIGTLVPHGLGEATTDRRVIAEWWALFPDANIAIRTGAISGVVVADVDPGNGGWESIERLEAEHGSLPVTPIVATGGGGAHVYFRHPGWMVPNSAGRIAQGIDIRGDGGYVIAPPSSHMSGTPYAWADGYTPDEVPLADLPEWLLPQDARHEESPRMNDDEMITEGGRNNRLMRIGAAFRRYGMTESEIAAALHIVNRTRCQPQLDDVEVGRIAASVARYQPDANTGRGSVRNENRKPRISVIGGQVVAS